MTTILWTEQARSDLAAIHAFITQDSPRYAAVVVRQLIAAIDQIATFPDSGRAVPEFENPKFGRSYGAPTASSTAWSAQPRFTF